MTGTIILDREYIQFRANIASAIACIRYYINPEAAIDSKKWTKVTRNHYTGDCVRMKLLNEIDGRFKPTELGLALEGSWGKPEFTERAHDFFKNDNRFKHVWSAVCKIGETFNHNDVTNLFMRISDRSIGKTTARTYSGIFLTWAKAAGVCRAEEVERNTIYRILESFDFPYELPHHAKVSVRKIIPRNSVAVPHLGLKADETHRKSIIDLNLLVSDFMADMTDDSDLNELKNAANRLRGHEIIDETVIDMLVDDIDMAVSSHDKNVKKLVGKALRRLRDRYLSRT